MRGLGSDWFSHFPQTFRLIQSPKAHRGWLSSLKFQWTCHDYEALLWNLLSVCTQWPVCPWHGTDILLMSCLHFSKCHLCWDCKLIKSLDVPNCSEIDEMSNFSINAKLNSFLWRLLKYCWKYTMFIYSFSILKNSYYVLFHNNEWKYLSRFCHLYFKNKTRSSRYCKELNCHQICLYFHTAQFSLTKLHTHQEKCDRRKNIRSVACFFLSQRLVKG